jgi:transposase
MDRGIRLALEGERPIAHIARDLGIEPESLRRRVRRAEIDAGKGEGLTTNERDELRNLRKESFELAARMRS